MELIGYQNSLEVDFDTFESTSLLNEGHGFQPIFEIVLSQIEERSM